MAWTVGTNANLSPATRSAQRKRIESNGLEWYARFQDGPDGRAAAENYAAKVKAATGVKLVIGQTYSTSIKL